MVRTRLRSHSFSIPTIQAKTAVTSFTRPTPGKVLSLLGGSGYPDGLMQETASIRRTAAAYDSVNCMSMDNQEIGRGHRMRASFTGSCVGMNQSELLLRENQNY